MDYTIAFKFFAALFATTNPFTSLPIFISLTSNKNANQIKNQALIAVTVITLITLFTGDKILKAFGISLGAFQTAGGIIIFLIALAMAQGKTSALSNSSAQEQDGYQQDNQAIVPLAVPLLSGPGTIATILIYHNYLPGTEGLVASLIVIAVSILLIWIVFSCAKHIKTFLGHTGIKIMTRIMGVILLSLAVEMIANGLKELLPL